LELLLALWVPPSLVVVPKNENIFLAVLVLCLLL
jgi:hypothetical protein